jgi:putative FmdB family regulatory protein
MLYDYQCHACGNIQEEYHKHTELNTFKFVCKECGYEAGMRMASAPKIVSIGSIDNNVFLGGTLTKMDTLNGKPKNQKKIYSKMAKDAA